MEWDPLVNVVVLYVACPPLRVTVLKVVVPSLKVIDPVAEAGNTEAVNVTDSR